MSAYAVQKKGAPRYSTEEKQAVGHRIVEARERAGLSQAELADAVGVRPHSMWRYEDGRTMPGDWALERIAEVTKVSVRWLKKGDEINRGSDPTLSDEAEQGAARDRHHPRRERST